MHECYFGQGIIKAGPEVLKNGWITVNVQSNYYNIRLSEKDLPNHYDVYGASHTKEDICNNVSIFQFVIPFKSHNTPQSVKKLLALRDTKVTQGPLTCPIKNAAEWVTTNDRYTSHINSPSFQDT
jgi:hypothetical protein